MAKEEQWLPLTQAAQQIGISAAKLSRLVKQNRVRSAKDTFDERITLVDLAELLRMYPQSKRRGIDQTGE